MALLLLKTLQLMMHQRKKIRRSLRKRSQRKIKRNLKNKKKRMINLKKSKDPQVSRVTAGKKYSQTLSLKPVKPMLQNGLLTKKQEANMTAQ